MPLGKLQNFTIGFGKGLPVGLCAGPLPDNRKVSKSVIIRDHAGVDNECIFLTRCANELRRAVRLVIHILHRCRCRAENGLEVALSVHIGKLDPQAAADMALARGKGLADFTGKVRPHSAVFRDLPLHLHAAHAVSVDNR